MAGTIIFNADDFGISKGVNAAIIESYQNGILNSASLMVNQKYAREAVAAAEKMPDLALGLHVNLTNEYPAADPKDIPLLVGADGKFKNGFVKLAWLALIKGEELKRQVRIEVEAQIKKALAMGAVLKHIDSHRHVHMIPVLFDIFVEMKEKYSLGRVRVINECGLLSALHNKGMAYLFDGGMIKYYLLRFFSIINGYASDTYFYTMLFTCKLAKNRFKDVRVPKGFNAVEVMIHPSRPDIDKNHMEDIFDQNILSPWRSAELETLLDAKVLEGFSFNADYPFLFSVYNKLEKWWFNLPQKIRFLLVGGFNTVFAYGVFAFLAGLIGLPYLLALIIQYFITVNVSIFTMRYYVFQSKGNIIKEYTKAWLVYIGMFAFNSAALAFLVEVCRMDELLGQALYLTVSTVLTYLLHKYFSFHKKIKEK